MEVLNNSDKALWFLMVLLNANSDSIKIPREDFEKLVARNEPLRVIQKVDADGSINLILEFCDCPKHRKQELVSDSVN